MRLGAAILVLAGLLAGSVVLLRPSAAPPLGSTTGLLADPGAVRYRFAMGGADAAAEDAAAIAFFEGRQQADSSALDAAELAEAYFRSGHASGNHADYDTAERHANRSLELLDSPNRARLTLAKLANARHDFTRGIELATAHLAHTRAAEGRGAHLVIATARLALGELPAAEAAANAALAVRPDTHGYLTRALVMQAQGRDQEASADFARAAAAEQAGDLQGAAHLRSLWARFLIRRGAYIDADTVLDEALRIVPEFPLAVAQRGELALRTRKHTEAARLFERAFERSRQVRYLLDEARARELAGDVEGASMLRAQTESIVRGDPRAHQLDLVEVLVDRGTREGIAEAVTLAQDELTRRKSFEVRFQLARSLARAGRHDEAMVQVQAMLATGAREAQLHELAAVLEKHRGNSASAAEHARAADRLDPARSGWRKLGIASP